MLQGAGIVLVTCVVYGGGYLTIDNQIAAVASDCYERLAIGDKLPEKFVKRIVEADLRKACERECDRDQDTCVGFSFGLSSTGNNGSCELATSIPDRNKLIQDPDFDVYTKKEECLNKGPSQSNYPYYPSDGHHKACFRRLLTGRRVVEQHVRRSLPAATLEVCQEECAIEEKFTCEGFNYRGEGGAGRGVCELTARPYSHMDPQRDFHEDRDFEFYERDRATALECNMRGNLYAHASPYGPWDNRPPQQHGQHGNSGPGPGQYGGGAGPGQYGSGGAGHGQYESGGAGHGHYGSGGGHYGSGGSGQGSHGSGGHYGNEGPRPGQGNHFNGDNSIPGGQVGFYGGGGGQGNYPPSGGGQGQYPPTGGGPGGNYLPPGGGGHHGGNQQTSVGHYGGSYPPTGGQYPQSPAQGGGYLPPHGAPRPPTGSGGYLPPHGAPRPPTGSGGYLPPHGAPPPPSGSGGYLPPHGAPPPPTGPGQYPPSAGGPPTAVGPYRPGGGPPCTSCEDGTVTPPPDGVMQGCFLRTRTGFRLDRLVTQHSLNADSIHACEQECTSGTKLLCKTFSYRYAPKPMQPAENCLLSTRAYKDLDPYSDFVPEKDFDIYEKNTHTKTCLSYPSPSIKPIKPDTECFMRVRSGQRLMPSKIREMTDCQSLGECELACLMSKHFTCRMFSFRYGSPIVGGPMENCELSDWQFMELDQRMDLISDLSYTLYERGSYGHGCEYNHPMKPHKPSRRPGTRRPAKPSRKPPGMEGMWVEEGGMRPTGGGQPYLPPSGMTGRPTGPMGGQMMWQGGFMAGSGPGQGQMQGGYGPTMQGGQGQGHQHHGQGQMQGGYGHGQGQMQGGYGQGQGQMQGGHSQGQMQGGYGQGQGSYPPQGQGGHQHHGQGQMQGGYGPTMQGGYGQQGQGQGGYPPQGQHGQGPPMQGQGGYGPTGQGQGHHGHHQQGQGQPGQPARPVNRPPDQLCYLGLGGPAKLMPSAVRSGMSVANEEACKAACSRAREEYQFHCTSLSYSETQQGYNCMLSDIGQRDLRPSVDYVPAEGNWLFSWNLMEPKCDVKEQQQYQGHFYPGRDDAATWQKFTVSGRPCRHGTTCTENREAGFWSCPLEGADGDSWDYCCRQGHQCGYSEGYTYPWCYVGSAAKDQWRPCSQQYFPHTAPFYGNNGQGGSQPGANPGHNHPGQSQGHNNLGQNQGHNQGQSQGHNQGQYPSGPNQGGNPAGHAGTFPHSSHRPHSGMAGAMSGSNSYGQGLFWPVAYLHHEGPGNSSSTHKPTGKPNVMKLAEKPQRFASENAVTLEKPQRLNDHDTSAKTQRFSANAVKFERESPPAQKQARERSLSFKIDQDQQGDRKDFVPSRPDEAFDNYLDNSKSIPSKKLVLFTPNATRITVLDAANDPPPQERRGKDSSKEAVSHKERLPTFEVVDENLDPPSVTRTKHSMRMSKSNSTSKSSSRSRSHSPRKRPLPRTNSGRTTEASVQRDAFKSWSWAKGEDRRESSSDRRESSSDRRESSSVRRESSAVRMGRIEFVKRKISQKSGNRTITKQ